jgi:tRNA modification GTPase
VSDIVVSVLTPAGSGAIATVEVAGPQAWHIARKLFAPAGKKPLPEEPPLHRFWFGKIADGDEVVLAVKQVEPQPRIEVHCHGGRRVVQWVTDQFLASVERHSSEPVQLGGLTPPARQLIHASTLRTASILLDQYHGAFERAVRGLIDHFSPEHLAALASYAPLGRHLVEPWKVAIAGPPNVGKSSLINALAGYQRSVVSAAPGTTRDVVTAQVAFDGWPVELADTAGIREAAGLEAEGIALADRYIREANLVLCVIDGADPQVMGWTPTRQQESASTLACASGSQSVLPPTIYPVINKCDQPPALSSTQFPAALRVSALTGEGIAGLAAAIARTLVPHAPPPGAAVPFTPQLADLVERAAAAATHEQALGFLRACS